jgi:hypothetical protein
MEKYVLYGLIAAAVLAVCGICYFVYNKYKNNSCKDNNCAVKKESQTGVCMGDVCTRPEVENIEPVDTTTLVSDESSNDSA